MAGATGLEPAASGVTGRRYNQLNYAPAKVVLVSRGEYSEAPGERQRNLSRRRRKKAPLSLQTDGACPGRDPCGYLLHTRGSR